MDANEETLPKKETPPESDPTTIDRNALAGSPTRSARSVRGGRPSTDDSVTEAMEEETPSSW